MPYVRRSAAYSATVSAERDTLAASCLSVVRKFAGSPGELLQGLLRVQPLVLDDFPLALVDLAEPVVALEVGGEQAQDDAVRHHDVGDVLQRAPLRLGDAHRLFERRVGEDDDDAGGVAAIAPLVGVLRLRAFRRRFHRRNLVERIEQRLRFVAATLRLERRELCLERGGIADEGMVLNPLDPFGRRGLDVAIADDLAAPIADRCGVVGAT